MVWRLPTVPSGTPSKLRSNALASVAQPPLSSALVNASAVFVAASLTQVGLQQPGQSVTPQVPVPLPVQHGNGVVAAVHCAFPGHPVVVFVSSVEQVRPAR